MSDYAQKHAGIELSGVEKAAALLLIMGRDSAVKLSSFFSTDEIKSLTETASRFETLDAATVNQLVSEFSKNYLSLGLFAEAEKLSDIFNNFQDLGNHEGDIGDMVTVDLPEDEKMPSVEEITKFIAGEPLHIGAFFLGTLDDDVCAEVMISLDSDKRNQLFTHLLDCKQIDGSLSELMRNELIVTIKQQSEGDGSLEQIEAAAGVINYLPEDTGEELLSFIKGKNPEAADVLKKSVFKFSSISDLEKEARSILFDNVDSDDVVSSLSGANDELKECVLEVLSPRNRRIVEAELSRITPASEVTQAARRKVSATAMNLAREDKISLPDSAVE